MSEKRSITQIIKNVNLTYESISSSQEPGADSIYTSVSHNSGERTVHFFRRD